MVLESIIGVKEAEKTPFYVFFLGLLYASVSKAIWCGKEDCEEKIKTETSAKSLNIPFNQKKQKGKCFHCNKETDYYAYFGKSY